MNMDELVYPYTDEYGYVWVDPYGFISKMHLKLWEDKQYKAPCFICSRMTSRVDIDYNAYFCRSYPCELTIEFDLKGIKYVNAEGY